MRDGINYAARRALYFFFFFHFPRLVGTLVDMLPATLRPTLPSKGVEPWLDARDSA